MSDEMPDMRETLGEAYDKITEEQVELGPEGEENVETDDTGEGERPSTVEEMADGTGEGSEPGDRGGEDVTESDEADVEDGGRKTDEEPETPDDIDEKPHPLDPLAHWLKKDKEMFETLEPKAQEFLIRRDKEWQSLATRKMQDVSDMQKALDPVREEMTMAGIGEADAVRRLVTAHVFLQKDPANGARWLFQQYGIDPSAILGTDESETESSDSAAMREIQKLREELKQRDRQTFEAERRAVQAKLVQFAETAEFYDKVEPEMLGIVNACKARGEQPPELEALYEQACWANAEVRKEMIRRQGLEKSDRETEAAKKAQRASATKVKGSRTSSNKKPTGTPKTLREDLLANLERQEADTRL